MAGIRQKIRENIVESLKGIEKGKGYNHTVKLVDDKRRSVEKLSNHQFPALFVLYGDPETSRV